MGGLSTTGLYAVSRNPMYAGLTFVALPGFAVVLDTLWPILLAPLLWSYLHFVVIAAEERLLHAAFGAAYEAYVKLVPRYFVCF